MYNCTVHKCESAGTLCYSCVCVGAHTHVSVCAGVFTHLHSLDSVFGFSLMFLVSSCVRSALSACMEAIIIMIDLTVMLELLLSKAWVEGRECEAVNL